MKRPSRHSTIPTALAGALLMVACADGTASGPSVGAQTGGFYLSYAPDPAVASASPDPDRDWVTRFTVRIRVIGDVAMVSLVEVGLSTDPAARLSLGPEEITEQAGTTRLGPRERLDVPVEIAYRGETSASDLQVVVRGTDERGIPLETRGGMPVR